ncbi:hypothetical protein J3459_019255 [Metarhizium acridum]|nr:hypothetical protein J3459_019255 [Metarhizium acridum]
MSMSEGKPQYCLPGCANSSQAMRSLEGQEFLGRQLKIQYAKSKSHFVSKLDGTFKIAQRIGGRSGRTTQLQQSIFNAPPPGSVAPAKPPAAVDHVMNDAGTPESRGQKRGREDEDEGEESESDVAMEEDSDDE